MQNVTGVGEQSATQLFLQSAQRWSDNIRWQVPTEDSWESVTWQTYCDKVCAVTAFLNKAGYGYPDKIGILAANSLEWIYAAMGTMSSTAVLVPIYAGNTIEQSLYMINHSDMQVLIADSPEQVQELIAAGLESTEVKEIILLNGNPASCITSLTVHAYADISTEGTTILSQTPGLVDDLARSPDMDDIAYMIYTSGTTGDPKGVPLSHLNLAISTDDWLKVNGSLVPDNVIDIHWLPNSHIYGWGAIGLGNLFGFESYLASPLNVLDLLPILKPSVFLSVPAYYEKLYLDALNYSNIKTEQIAKLKELSGDNLHFMLSGGAGLKLEIKEFFLEAGLWITEGYGLSECSPTLTMNHKDDYRFDSVGKPFPSVQLKLASDGEILAKGGNVFAGYYKDPEATEDCFTTDGWFKTGDLGKWLDGGFLEIVDRKKDIIVTSGGKNIAPQGIERLFAGNPYIENILVYGSGKKYVVALVTLNELSVRKSMEQINPDENDWISLIRQPEVLSLVQQAMDNVNAGLASYETIKYFHITGDHFAVANKLLTAALKLRRKAAIQRYQAELDELYITETNTTA